MWKAAAPVILLKSNLKANLPKQKTLKQLQLCRTFLSSAMPEVQQMDPGIKSYQDLYKFSIEQVQKTFENFK